MRTVKITPTHSTGAMTVEHEKEGKKTMRILKEEEKMEDVPSKPHEEFQFSSHIKLNHPCNR